MRQLSHFAWIVGFLAAAPAAFGQGAVWKIVQPWTPRLAAHESRVQSCANPAPLNQIAADDWICGATGPIVRVEWWGNLSSPQQAKRPFYIAIYSNFAAVCQPNLAAPLFSICTVPDYCRKVGTDCQNRPVYQISAPLPGFSQVQGFHYWLQVSEADAESLRPGLEDFRWSSHRAINNCPAISAFPVVQPIADACDQQPEDLAFGLASRVIVGTVPPGVITATLRLYDPSLSMMLEEVTVAPDPDGNFIASPELPDGTYVAELVVDCHLKQRQVVQLANGQQPQLSFFDIFAGDLDNDGTIGLPDLSQTLSNYGKVGP